MKCTWLVGSVLTLLVVAAPAWGASDPRVESLALCQASWLDWKTNDPSALSSFGAFFRSAFVHNDNDAFVTPKSDMTINGLRITQVYPESLGTGVGFSVLVEAPFNVAKQALEKNFSKPVWHCQASEGMQTCELPVAEQRTVMLASNDTPNGKSTLVGCYYYYEK